MMHPLEDRSYEPKATPVNGRPPDVVERWGAASQLRWFKRFQGDLTAMPHREWDRFYADSADHRGLCCVSCIEDKNEGYGWDIEGCCCRRLHKE